MTDRKKSGIDKNALEGEEGLSPSSEDVYPDAKVKISRDQYSIFEIRRMLKDTKELIIDPEFQRNAVWKIGQERELIENVLMSIPIPIIYVFEEKDGKKQVVDGRQRIYAMVRYLDNEFALDNLTMLPQLEGLFQRAMNQSFAILGADGFRFEAYNVNRRPINMALFETLAHFFTLVDLRQWIGVP